MPWPDRVEVAAAEHCDLGDAEPLGGRYAAASVEPSEKSAYNPTNPTIRSWAAHSRSITVRLSCAIECSPPARNGTTCRRFVESSSRNVDLVVLYLDLDLVYLVVDDPRPREAHTCLGVAAFGQGDDE